MIFSNNFTIFPVILLIAFMLSGCSIYQSVRGPSGAKFDTSVVCNHSRGTNCSPTVGHKLPLVKQQITMELKAKDGDFQPLLTSYLGTIVRREQSRFGEPGALCGDKNTSNSPFLSTDFTENPVYRNDVTINETFGRNSKASFAADLKKAISAAGVPQKIIDRLKSEVDAEAEVLSGKVSNSTVEFVEYRIKESALRKLEMARSFRSGTSELRMKECLTFLLEGTIDDEKSENAKNKNSNWRMYQALTGFKVKENTSAALSVRQVSVDFIAELKDEINKASSSEVDDAIKTELIRNIENGVPAETETQDTSSTSTASGGNNSTSLTESRVRTTVGVSRNTGIDDNAVGGLDAYFKQVRKSNASGKSDPYFVVLGLSHWRSPRYKSIN